MLSMFHPSPNLSPFKFSSFALIRENAADWGYSIRLLNQSHDLIPLKGGLWTHTGIYVAPMNWSSQHKHSGSVRGGGGGYNNLVSFFRISGILRVYRRVT